MKKLSLFLSAMALLAASPAAKAETVLCSPSSQPVLAYNLHTVLFTAARSDRVKAFQGWGVHEKSKVVNGEPVTFVKVQFPEQEGAGNAIGWVPKSVLKDRQDCEGDVRTADLKPAASDGLDASTCCEFPLRNKPTESYYTAPRAFGSDRDDRKHAAADLYRKKYDRINAVTDGVVQRGHYLFYQGTYAIEVQHSGGFVVRYGEVTGKAFVRKGAKVRPGQQVGNMGKTSCCTPMLHFELYSGSGVGPLSTDSGIYHRRSDLLNPTAYLQKWQDSSLRGVR